MRAPRTPEEIMQALASRRVHASTGLQLRVAESRAKLSWLGMVNGPLLQFAAKRPVLVGVAAAAVMLAGPVRLLGWAAKASTLWRLVSAVSARE